MLDPGTARAVLRRHPDIPRAVWPRLPELIADPLYVHRRADGAVSGVTAATTARGEPVVVGLRGNDVRTVTPRHDTTDERGMDRELRIVARAWERGETIYARDASALDGLQRHLAGYDPGARAARRQGRGGKILTRDGVIKAEGRIFYSLGRGGSAGRMTPAEIAKAEAGAAAWLASRAAEGGRAALGD